MTRNLQNEAARPVYEPPCLVRLSAARDSAAICTGPGSSNIPACVSVGSSADDCRSGSNTLACNMGTSGTAGCSPAGSAF